jgi:hypothetical protein
MSRTTAKTVGLALVLAGALVAATTPAATAADPDDPVEPVEPQCMDIYLGEGQVGPVHVDASDSCPEVTIEKSASKPQCMQVYLGEYEVGPVHVDASDTCIEVHVDEDWQPTRSANCLQVYIEYSVGPVTYTYNCGGELTVDENYNPATDNDNLPEYCTVVFEKTVGPVTVSDTCDGDAVQVNLVTPTDHTQPADPEDKPKCVLTADDGTERFMCIFGPPGP